MDTNPPVLLVVKRPDAEVTVEAGTLSALFDIAATDNPWIEGERLAGVTAGAPGFLSGGASVRLPRLSGVSRMRDMMLTGRVHDAESGERLGLSHYVMPPGEGLERAIALAARAAENAPLTNYALIHALPRIAEADPATGYLTEALMTAVAQSDAEAKRRLAANPQKYSGRVYGEEEGGGAHQNFPVFHFMA